MTASKSTRPEATAADRTSALKEEERRLRRMRILVSLATQALYQDRDLTVQEARQLVGNLRRAVLNLFPGKEATFEIVLRPRLERILVERWGVGLEPRVH